MNHSIENIDGTFSGALHRHPIDGKRRIMVWASALHRLSQNPQTFDQFKKYIINTRLRNGTDYHRQHHDIRLSISAVQALLVMQNTAQTWQLHHHLSDLIQRGFQP